MENPIQNAKQIKHKNHHSIKIGISKTNPNNRLSFCPVLHDETLKQIKNLAKKSNRAKQYPNIIVKAEFQKTAYQCIKNSRFLFDLKLADVTSCNKKKSKTSKDNYKPISMLYNTSKIYQ